MALARLVDAWLVVSVWLLACAAVGIGRAGWPAPRGRLRTDWWIAVGEALWLTLLGGLWFGSLGRGGWGLVFLLLGLLVAWPGVAASRAPSGPVGRGLTLTASVGRVLVAGGLLAWRLG